MNDSDRKFTMTDRDLLKDYDETKLNRIGKPIGIEHHDVGAPDTAETVKAKTTHTLGDMAKDFEFFTTAVIHATTPFDRDPVAEFNNINPAAHNDELPLVIDCVAPFFRGLGITLVAGMPVNLDRRLYAVARHRWHQLRDTISGMAMMDRKTSFYARLVFYEMTIVDTFALKKLGVVSQLPTVTITVFGVSSNKAFSYIAPSKYPLLPSLVSEQPKTDALEEGQVVLGPPISPEHLLPRTSSR